MSLYIPPASRDRLLSRLTIDPSGCLLWTGATSRGYGQIRIAQVQYIVHRLMYQLFAGPIPDGLDLDHLCRVRRCASPAHLEPVTRAINLARGLHVNHLAEANAAKTHCLRGHPFDSANTYIPPGTAYRNCRACMRIREHDRQARRAAR